MNKKVEEITNRPITLIVSEDSIFEKLEKERKLKRHSRNKMLNIILEERYFVKSKK